MNETQKLFEAIANLKYQLDLQNLRSTIKIEMPKEDILAVSFRIGRDFDNQFVMDAVAGDLKFCGALFVEVSK